jgi:hypothetical protein
MNYHTELRGGASARVGPVRLAMLPTTPRQNFWPKNSKNYIYLQKMFLHYRPFFDNSEENSTIFLVTQIFNGPLLSSTQCKGSRSGRIQNVWAVSGSFSDLGLFGRIRTRSETLSLGLKFRPWRHGSCAWIEIAESFSLCLTMKK